MYLPSSRASWCFVALFTVGCAQGESLTDGTGATGPGPGSGAGGEGSTSSSTTGGGGAGASGAAGGEGGVGGGFGGQAPSGGGGEGGAENKCGNGMLNPGESCDGDLLGEADCVSIAQGFIGGTLACAADCSFDTSGCEVPANCGNGTLNAGEDCDGNLLGGASCISEGFGAGTISCGAGCTLDVSQCYTCGNGTVEPAEVCDGVNFEGASCESLGHDAGTLSCAANCKTINQNACTDCGDGTIEGLEQCDGNNLGGQTCISRGFSGGSLSCTAGCEFNTASCTGQTCGNGVIEGAEICDGTTLAGQTCASQGFLGGNLACNASCNGYVTTGCTGSQCQNGADDDADGFTDLSDPGCSNAADNDETLFAPSCNGVGSPIYDVTFANTSLDVVVTGSTVGVPNAYAPTDFTDDCTSATGGEMVLMYRVLSPISVMTISTWNPGTTFDTVLYVRLNGCGPGAPEACNDEQFFSSRAELTLINVTPGDYYIIVDGWNGASGNVELTIDIPNAYGVN